MNQYLPVEASSHAHQIDQLIGYVHILMFVLFVGWGAFFVYTLFRFRKAKNPKADSAGVTNHYSTYLEVLVALVEAVLLFCFSIPLWRDRVDRSPSPADALQVNVIAEQFAWNVHYAGPDKVFGKGNLSMVNTANPTGLDRSGDPAAKDDVVTLNQLHLPVNKPVIINITSKDVIHSFALQEMRIKQDSIPGQSTPVWFIPTKTTEEVREAYAMKVSTSNPFVYPTYGPMKDYTSSDGKVLAKAFQPLDPCIMKDLASAGISEIEIGPITPMEISCAQLCGIGHYRMKGYVTVESEEKFEAWLKSESEAAATAGSGGYE